jgi:uncharacterized protein (DUF3084 family)
LTRVASKHNRDLQAASHELRKENEKLRNEMQNLEKLGNEEKKLREENEKLRNEYRELVQGNNQLQIDFSTGLKGPIILTFFPSFFL